MRARAVELGSAAEEKLPAVKLADYYEETYRDSSESSGVEFKYENEKACRDSVALRSCLMLSEVGIVRKMLQHWLRHEGFTGKEV